MNALISLAALACTVIGEMSEPRNLEGAQAESAAATQDSGSKLVVSDCDMIKSKNCPPQALNVLKKSDEAGDIEKDEVTILRQNLRAILNDPDYSDVQFVCKDGGKVLASRVFLVARSPMLKGLLSNGMAESKLSKIELPTVSSPAMLAIVEFLYTGGIEMQHLTWVSAFDTIHACNYLLIDTLRDYVMTFLCKALKVEMDGEFAAWCLTELAVASGGEHLLENSLSARLVRELVSKIQNADPNTSNSLSLPAFNLYLDATESANNTNISFKEYLRLRSILLWACSRVSPMMEGELRKCLLDDKWFRLHKWEMLNEQKISLLASGFRTMADSGLQIGSCIETLDDITLKEREHSYQETNC